MRKYCISISGTAARLLQKHYPQFYADHYDILEGFYCVKAKNGEAAKQLFKKQYREATVFEKAAKLLEKTLPETLRAYPG